jgi:hypothetical protein
MDGLIRYDDILQGGMYGYSFFKDELISFDLNPLYKMISSK